MMLRMKGGREKGVGEDWKRNRERGFEDFGGEFNDG